MRYESIKNRFDSNGSINGAAQMANLISVSANRAGKQWIKKSTKWLNSLSFESFAVLRNFSGDNIIFHFSWLPLEKFAGEKFYEEIFSRNILEISTESTRNPLPVSADFMHSLRPTCTAESRYQPARPCKVWHLIHGDFRRVPSHSAHRPLLSYFLLRKKKSWIQSEILFVCRCWKGLSYENHTV